MQIDKSNFQKDTYIQLIYVPPLKLFKIDLQKIPRCWNRAVKAVSKRAVGLGL